MYYKEFKPWLKVFLTLVLSVFLCIYCDRHIVYGDNVIKIEDGALTFITNDTKATSGIKWKTAGFTITDKPCLGDEGNGGYPTKYNHATVMIKQEDIISTDMGDGRIRSKFFLSESKLSKILVDAGFADTIQEGGTLYLNCIFQVTKNGANYGSLIYDYNSIRNAQPWKNPDDFYDRFDIKVVYKGKSYSADIEYKLEDGTVVSTKSGGAYKVGNTFAVALDKTITHEKNEYQLITSFYVRKSNPQRWVSCKKLDFGYSLNDIAAVSGKMPINGVKICGIYRKVEDATPNNEIVYLEGRINGVAEAKIDSNYYGKELFEAGVRIPTGEELYVYANVPRYIYKGELVKNNVIVTQKVEITIPYLLKWKEKENINGSVVYKDKEKEVVKTQVVNVETPVSYWTVEKLRVLKADTLYVTNELLGNKTDKIAVGNTNEIGDASIDCLEKTLEYVTYNKTTKKIKLNTIQINGTYSEPDIPTFNYMSVAKENVETIYVANDKLVLGRNEVLSNEKQKNKTKEPQKYKELKNQRGIAYKSGYLIEDDKDNGNYISSAAVTYKTVVAYNPPTLDNVLELDINSVNVHTPVVCDGKVSTDLVSSQLIEVDRTKPVLVVDSFFMVDISTKGTHVNSKGYGYKDYSKYISECYVVFPFNVKINDELKKAGQMVKIVTGKTKVYIPSDVTTGKYQITFYVKATNCKNKSGDIYQQSANTNLIKYCAFDKVDVEVSGRVFNLSIYDISDYPLWEKVFRNESGKLNGTRYRSGQYNYWKTLLIADDVYTLPLRNGSHPYIVNKGAQKSGYSYKMYLDTMGDFDDQDYVWIVPSFFYVSSDGKIRKEVDLYYSETITIDGKTKKYHFVKVGSEIDKKNIKEVSNTKLFTYGNIMVPGKLSVESKNTSKKYKRWYFEYYLPSQTYMVDKDVHINKDEYFGMNSQYIYRDGYLVVNFDIEVIKDGKRYISYENKINSSLYNCCNMWKKEGMPLSITDNKGTVYNISYGDIMFIDNNASAGKDYLAGGTH